MSNAQEQLKKLAKKLFNEKRVDLILAFEQGTVDGRARPLFVHHADEADRIVWNDTCSHNLAVYLPNLFKRKPAPRGQEPPPLPTIGVALKGCDALSIELLVREHQVPRENLIVIGMPCQGISDPATGDIMPSCRECAHPTVPKPDMAIEGPSRKASATPYETVEAFESKSMAERWAAFTQEVSKCIMCHACRQACPNCYCKECFADQTNPRWISLSRDESDKMMYHLGRMFHQAGRCVACDACARACPMGLNLRAFTHKLAKEARELFDYEIGAIEDVPLFCQFDTEDSDDFITDPDKQEKK